MSALAELRKLFRYRMLIQSLVGRELKARYRGSILGFFWSFVNPLLLLLTYGVVFTYMMPGVRGPDVEPYFLFLFCGILPWTWFSASLTEASGSLIAGGNLIKKVMFPAEALPLVVVTSHLVHFVLALPILLFAIIAFALSGNFVIQPTLALVPFVMMLQAFFVAGIAMAVASMSVLFRDLRDILTNLITLGFFITPILYLIDTIGSRPLRALLRLNPMTPFVVTYQDLIFFGHLPGIADTFLMIAYAFVSLFAGFTIFERLRDVLAEAI